MMIDPHCRRITLMWGAQTGKTQLINCGQAYFVAQRPCSQMMMQPSQGDLTTWLETKFNPLIESNPVLQNLVAKPRARDGVNNQRMKSYPGGWLMFSWSGSPKTMRGRSAPKIWCDEVDGYERTAEGDAVDLLWQRAATFGDDRLLVATSTPTIKGASKVEDCFESGDQRRYFIPCPHCNEFQTLKWSNVVWDKDDDGNHVPATARYACEECGCFITDGEKMAALKRGEWRAAKPFRGHASYHLSELYSSFRKWRDIVESFLEKKETNSLQTFVNVSLAETWEEEGESVEHNALYLRREFYEAVPNAGLVLVAGVDVQDDRIEGEIIAYGEGFESWGVDYFVIHGDPGRAELWNQLQQRLDVQYKHECGDSMSIAAACVDSGGHYTQQVYEFCKKNSHRRIWAIKGSSERGKPIISGRASKSNKGKVNLFSVGTDTAKELIYSRLKIAEPGPGFCHFPQTYDEEFFLQLTAEKRVKKFVKGFPRLEWVKTRPRNEALDCRVYALAAITNLNPVFSAIKQRFVPEAAPVKEKQPEPQETPTEQLVKVRKHRQVRKTKRGGFVNKWR